MNTINIEKLKEKYPGDFETPDYNETQISLRYTASIFLIVSGIVAILVSVGKILAALIFDDRTLDSAMGILRIAASAGSISGGLVLFKKTKAYKGPEGPSEFELEIRNVFKEITENNYAVKHEKIIPDFVSYNLHELIDSYHVVNKESYRERHETLAFLIMEEITSPS